MKKKIIGGIAAVILACLGLTLGASMALGYDIWDSCRKTDDLCYYPGDCRSYIDTNNDGICDRSQPEMVTETTVTTEEAQETQEPLDTVSPESDISSYDTSNDDTSSGITAPAITDDDTGAGSSGDAANNGGNLDRYFLLPVLLGTAVAYGITWILSNRRIMSVKIHRRIWNVVLLLVTVVSALLGIYLILEIDFDISVSLPINPLFWHVEAGIAMGMIAVFHIAWHWRYFEKMLKRTAAEA